MRTNASDGTARADRQWRAVVNRPEPPSVVPVGFELMPLGKPPGYLRRLLVTHAHLLGLGAGAFLARTRALEASGQAGPVTRYLRRGLAAAVRPFVRRELRDLPFPVQFRRRLELLGPTYIKLGQILSLRADLLPESITAELRNLLDRLPVAPFDVITAIIERELRRPVAACYAWIDPVPLGSASIAQIHRARTLDGDDVVIKVVKPGIREVLYRDARLLRGLGAILQWVVPHYTPKRIIREFVDYTLREVDLRREGDNAATFAANFADVPDVVFPRIHRELTARGVVTMTFLDGLRPDSLEAQRLPHAVRERLVDLGAMSIIRMLYQDGVFHADLHPGNLLVLPGGKVGFIDLGMVGRLDPELKRALLYYYYCLVTGDSENAARYLTVVAHPGPGSDIQGFRREVAEISARWRLASTFEDFSLAQLILESLTRGARYHMHFPVEMVLMVKALITFEGVGHMLLPGFDVAEVSQRHIRAIFLHQFSPFRLLKEELRSAPDLMEALVKAPLLVTEGLQVLDRATRQRTENPFAGMRGTLIAGFCLVAAAILMAFGGPWPLWSLLFAAALLLALHRDEGGPR
jgi:ubiquinone biosynthesis protein